MLNINTMWQYLREAVFNALEDLGNDNRDMVLCHMQKHYAIRFVSGEYPTALEVRAALNETFGSAAHVFVRRFEEELEKHPVAILKV